MNTCFLTAVAASIACSVNADCLVSQMENTANQELVIKKKKDHIEVQSPFCGRIIVVSTPQDNPKVDIALAINIRPTTAHFHERFEETYMVLDGWLVLQLFDPKTEQISTVKLEANELAMIPKGMHHRIVEASEENRLQVICVPGFNAADEHPSDRI